MIPIMWGVITLSFFVIRLTPGGPFDFEKPISDAVRKNLEAKFQFDQPLWKQYGQYLWDVVNGDLGPSFKNKDVTVNEIIAAGLPVSLELGAYAMGFACFFGVLLGCIAALFRNRWPDTVATGISVVGLSVPNMVLGPVLVLVLSLYLSLFPTSGWDHLPQKVLPSFTLGMIYLAVISRLMRSGLLDVISKDFIRTARAKGLKEKIVIRRHAFRAAVLPVVSFLGPAIAFVVTGSVVVEKIFGIPGIGRFFVTAALNRDYTVVLGITIVLSLFVLMMNLLVDLTYHVLDPRIQLHEKQVRP